MNYKEYGKENNDVIILLHGGGLSWWNYREAAEMLSADYRVILPILDGHADSGYDFVSIEDNAKRIIEFIDERFSGSVMMLGGLSLGGQVALEILAERGDIAKYALIESALVIHSKFTYSMIKPAFGSSYGLVKKRWFARLQFKSLKMKEELFEDYFRDSSSITKANMISFLESNSIYSLKPSIADSNAKSYIFVGGKESPTMRRSAEIIRDSIVGSSLEILPGLYHGELSINYPRAYAERIRSILHGE